MVVNEVCSPKSTCSRISDLLKMRPSCIGENKIKVAWASYSDSRRGSVRKDCISSISFESCEAAHVAVLL